MRVQSENSNAAESLDRTDADTKQDLENLLPVLARRAVETFVRENQRVLAVPNVPNNSLLGQRAACFVSIKTHEGELRGCIGTVEPVTATLAKEVITNAISAAIRDPRFLPVTTSELPQLRFSVDVLSPPESARLEELNPKIYGLIVENESAQRRGLLLPDLEGVETVEQQLHIAACKAGIPSGAKVNLYRFRVRRYGD